MRFLNTDKLVENTKRSHISSQTHKYFSEKLEWNLPVSRVISKYGVKYGFILNINHELLSLRNVYTISVVSACRSGYVGPIV